MAYLLKRFVSFETVCLFWNGLSLLKRFVSFETVCIFWNGLSLLKRFVSFETVCLFWNGLYLLKRFVSNDGQGGRWRQYSQQALPASMWVLRAPLIPRSYMHCTPFSNNCCTRFGVFACCAILLEGPSPSKGRVLKESEGVLRFSRNQKAF